MHTYAYVPTFHYLEKDDTFGSNEGIIRDGVGWNRVGNALTLTKSQPETMQVRILLLMRC